MNPSKFSIVAAAMRKARRQNLPSRTVKAWAEEFQVATTYVYRIAEFYNLRDFFAVTDRSEAVVKIGFHTCEVGTKERTVKPIAMVPSTLLRYAKLGDKGRLRMRVIEPGKILVEAAIND